jgi:hypothetical protein
VTKSFASLPLCGFDCYDRFRIGYAEFKEPQSKSKQILRHLIRRRLVIAIAKPLLASTPFKAFT